MIVADTSALIGAWRLHYPPSMAPGFWTFLDAAIRSGTVVVLDIVYDEIAEQSDELLTWLKAREQFVLSTPRAAQEGAGRLHERWAFKPGRDKADPFVIAYAQETGYAVATYEGLSPTGSTAKARGNKDNMPTICDGEGVECLKPADAWARAGLSF